MLKLRIFWYVLIIAAIVIFPFETDMNVKDPIIIGDATNNNNFNNSDKIKIDADTNGLFSELHIPGL